MLGSPVGLGTNDQLSERLELRPSGGGRHDPAGRTSDTKLHRPRAHGSGSTFSVRPRQRLRKPFVKHTFMIVEGVCDACLSLDVWCRGFHPQ